MTLILDSEVWKQAEVPSEFQALADKLRENGLCCKLLLSLFLRLSFAGKMTLSRTELEGSLKRSDTEIRPIMPSNVLMIGDEKYSVVGSVSEFE